MAQEIQRDPLSIASGGLPGLYGVSFSPLPPTEGDVAARSRALVPQFSSPSVAVVSTPVFRPTAQAALPTPLLQRPEEIGRAAFRPISGEAQFPALRPAETIEEIDQRLSSIFPLQAFYPYAPTAPTSPVDAGSVFGRARRSWGYFPMRQPTGPSSTGSIFEEPNYGYLPYTPPTMRLESAKLDETQLDETRLRSRNYGMIFPAMQPSTSPLPWSSQLPPAQLPPIQLPPTQQKVSVPPQPPSVPPPPPLLPPSSPSEQPNLPPPPPGRRWEVWIPEIDMWDSK